MNTSEMAEELFYLLGKFQRGPVQRIQDVTRGEIAMLGSLIIEGRDTTPTELSERFRLSTARVANTLNSLEKKGYIQRLHDTKDRRKVIVRITDTGREVAERKHGEAIQHMTDLLSDLGPEDAYDLLRIIRKVNGLIENVEKNADDTENK